MRNLTRFMRSVVLITILGATFVTTAEAAPDWVAPATILPTGANRVETRIGFDSTGKETISQAEVISTAPTVLTRVTIGSRETGDPLANEVTVSSGGDRYPVSASLAVAPSGAAVVCLTELVGPDPFTAPLGYRAMYRAAGSSTWSNPTEVALNPITSLYSLDCIPTIGADGSAAVVAQRAVSEPPGGGEPRRAEIVALVRDAGGDWGNPQVLSGADRVGEDPQAKMDDSGNLTVAWRERWAGNTTATTSDDRQTMKLRTRMAGNGFFGSTTDPVGGEGNSSKDVYLINFSSNQDGRAVVAWQDFTTGHVWAATRVDSAASFGTPQQIINTGSTSGPGATGVAPDGTAYIGYRAQNGITNDSAGMIRQPLGQGWSSPQPIGPLRLNSAFGDIAFLDNDAYFVVADFLNPMPVTSVMFAVRWRSAQPAPDAFRDLIAPASDSPTVVGFVPDRQGSLVASYESSQPPVQRTLTVAFDGSPPRAKVVNIPASATPGATVNLSAEFADRWSDLAGTTWSFGDGANASGDSVSHAWAAPGDYTVKVTGRDARGNERTSTAQIKVESGGGPGVDAVKPKVTLKKPACGKKKAKPCKAFRKKRAAWRTLKGTASDNESVARVEVAVARKSGKKFDVLKGKKFDVLKGKKFKKRQSAGRAAAAFNKAKLNGKSWSFSIPKSWKAGAYTFRVRAVDGAGNASPVLVSRVKLR